MLILYICLVAPQNSVADETTLALGAFDISGSAELLMQVEYDPGAGWADFEPVQRHPRHRGVWDQVVPSELQLSFLTPN
jgi:hypothetical protein